MTDEQTTEQPMTLLRVIARVIERHGLAPALMFISDLLWHDPTFANTSAFYELLIYEPLRKPFVEHDPLFDSALDESFALHKEWEKHR